MSDMPETIWADAPDIFDGMGLWVSSVNDRGTEYVRADLARASLAAAIRENCVECAGTGTAQGGDGICQYCGQVTPADAIRARGEAE